MGHTMNFVHLLLIAKQIFSCKQKLTVNTQVVIGANLEFLDAATGYPGSVYDARVLQSTTLFQQAEAQITLSTPLKGADNVK